MKKILTRKTYKGLYNVLPTPFDKQGKFSPALLRKMLKVMIQYDIDGIVIAGTNGEYFSLEEKEKIQMTEIAAEILLPTKINLVVGGTALSLNEQIKLGRGLRKAGAQALMNRSPFASAITDNEYCEFWKRLSGKIGDIGLIIYNFAFGAPLPNVKTLVKVAREVPEICGTKEGHRDLKRWHYLFKNTDFTPIPANDWDWITYYKKGSVSFMSPSGSICPQLFCEIHKGLLDRKWKDTEPLHKDMARMWDIICYDKLLAGYGGVASLKAVCRALGWIEPGLSRAPLIDVPDNVQKKLNRKIAKIFPSWCRKS